MRDRPHAASWSTGDWRCTAVKDAALHLMRLKFCWSSDRLEIAVQTLWSATRGAEAWPNPPNRIEGTSPSVEPIAEAGDQGWTFPGKRGLHPPQNFTVPGASSLAAEKWLADSHETLFLGKPVKLRILNPLDCPGLAFNSHANR